MSNDFSVKLTDVGKRYKLHPSPLSAVLDLVSLSTILPFYRKRVGEFWALRGVNLEVKKGERFGIVGRNGAGKSTLLKLVSGSLQATEGTVDVVGTVDALANGQSGFHPELTGLDNINAMLAYHGLSRKEQGEARADIADFTELGEFLAQPVKTYSSGMQSRLLFAIATCVRPDVLIVDEQLGAGDAYFIAKSRQRVQKLVDSGATLLLVSHVLPQITMFCERAIWVDRGRIIQNGPSMQVVKAYQKFINHFEDSKLRYNHHVVEASGYQVKGHSVQPEKLSFVITLDGQTAGSCDVSEVVVYGENNRQACLKVGDAQDANQSHGEFVDLTECDWSSPLHSENRFFRRIERVSTGAGRTARKCGRVTFQSFELIDEGELVAAITYRTSSGCTPCLEIEKNGQAALRVTLPDGTAGWVTERVAVGRLGQAAADFKQPLQAADRPPETGPSPLESNPYRWGGIQTLGIRQVRILGADGERKAVFAVGERLVFRLTIGAQTAGEYDIIPALALYREDGLFVSNHVGPPERVVLQPGEPHVVEMELAQVNLGNGSYSFSASLFRSAVVIAERYDLLDLRGSYSFLVVGNDNLHSESVFQHPSVWRTPSRQRADRNCA